MTTKMLFYSLFSLCLVGSMTSAMEDRGPLALMLKNLAVSSSASSSEQTFNLYAQQLHNIDQAFQKKDHSRLQELDNCTDNFLYPYLKFLTAQACSNRQAFFECCLASSSKFEFGKQQYKGSLSVQDKYMSTQHYTEILSFPMADGYVAPYLNQALYAKQNNQEEVCNMINACKPVLGKKRTLWWQMKENAIRTGSFAWTNNVLKQRAAAAVDPFSKNDIEQLRREVITIVSSFGGNMDNSNPLVFPANTPEQSMPSKLPVAGYTGPKLLITDVPVVPQAPAPAVSSLSPQRSPQQSSFLSRLFPTRTRKVVALGALAALGAGITYWFWNRK